MLHRILALVKKDLLLEVRMQHTFYGILLYVAATVYVLYMSLKGDPEPNVWNSLFWVIQLFVCINAVAKSFLQESKGRMLYYYTIVSPAEFILGKIIYSAILMLFITLVTYLLFIFFLGTPLLRPGLFFGISLIGGLSLSIVFTLMSALAAKAGQNAALMAILGFPVILPLLMIVMQLSHAAFGEVFREGAVLQLTGLVLLIDVLVLVLALVLFPFIWKD